MRIFLDANILFSASKSVGAVHALMQLLVAQKHALVADEYVVAEARRNLDAKSDAASVKRLDAWLKKIAVAPTSFNAADTSEAAWLPDKDRPVLAAAISLRCDALVTGDVTHFGSGFGKAYGGVVLYSPRMLYDHLMKLP